MLVLFTRSVFAAHRTIDDSEVVRATLVELLSSYKVSFKNVDEIVNEIPNVLVVDAKSLYDGLVVTETSMSAETSSRRHRVVPGVCLLL